MDLHPKYEKIGEEIAYILTQHVCAAHIEYASIIFRTKTLDSFCEKVIRKAYTKPLDEISDIAGVRIVYLYLSDCDKLKNLIEKEFNVIEKVDKIDKSELDRFGYSALHYLVKLGKGSSGARYDDLKNFTCEIQVRTILQDAWAMVAHHLSYKQESDVPKELRRKLNALSGLFETADDQFNRLKEDRLEYKSRLKEDIVQMKEQFLDQDINLDNLTEFLNWRLSDRGTSSDEDISALLRDLKNSGYKKIKQVDHALWRASDAVKALEAAVQEVDEETGYCGRYSPVSTVRVSMNFVDDNFFRFIDECKYSFRAAMKGFRHLVKHER
jgi:putative GTP pyrophosphokinase